MGSTYDRFFGKIYFTDTCWLWTGAITKAGYGMFSSKHKLIYAHRYSYLIFKGDLVKPLEIDHLCRVTNCVNPEHLEQVTRKVNQYRGLAPTKFIRHQALKTHCPRGHEYTEENIYRRKDRPTHRDCLTCRKTYFKRRIKPLVLTTNSN